MPDEDGPAHRYIGAPGSQARQSVCVHRIGLLVAREWGYDSPRVVAALWRAADGSHRFRRLASRRVPMTEATWAAWGARWERV